MIIKRQKEFGLFGFGKAKTFDLKELSEEYKTWTVINPEVTKYLRSFGLPTNSIDKGVLEYLSLLYEKFPEGIAINKDGEEVYGWDQVVKYLKKFKNNFGGTPLIILGKSENTDFMAGDYMVYFPKQKQIWSFFIQWGNISQGMFGIGTDCRKSIQIFIG